MLRVQHRQVVHTKHSITDTDRITVNAGVVHPV